MADETFKAMAVEIAMENGSFQQGVKDLKQQLNAIDSEFKAGINGATDWGDSIDGLRAHTDALSDKIEVQRKIVGKYEDQLKKAEAALEDQAKTMLQLKDRLESSRKAWEESSEALGKNAEETKKLETEYKALEKQYDKAENLVRKNQSTVQGYTIQLNNARAALGKFENELESTNKDIDAQTDKLDKASKKMQETGEKMKDASEKMTVGLTAPILAAGGLFLKGAMDGEAAQGRLQASLGLTADAAADLEAVAQAVWLNGFGENIGEANAAITKIRTNMGDLAEDEMQQAAEGAMTIADIFEQDIPEVAAAAGVAMKNFKVDSQTALDALTVGFQRGGDYSGELLDTIREYSPQFASLGLTIDQTMGILIAGAQAGSWNLDKVGDSVKEFNIRAQDGSKTTADGFAAIGLNAQDMGKKIADGGESAQKAFIATITALAGMKDPLEQNQAGVALFGTQWEDVRSDVITALAAGTKGLGEFKGATAEAAAAMYENNPAAAMTSAMRELQTAVGPALLPLANVIKDDIAPAIKSLAEGFANLPESGQKAILIIAGLAAAAGPATWAFGGMTTGIGKLIGGAGRLAGILAPATAAAAEVGGAATVATGAAGAGGLLGLGSSLGAAAIAAGPWLLAAGAVVGAGYLINKEMSEEAIPAVDLFADKVEIAGAEVESANLAIGQSTTATAIKISEGTKQAVGAYMQMDKQAEKSLADLYVNGTQITGQTVTSIVGQYDKMGAQVKAGMAKHQQQELADMQAFFAKSNALTAAEEAQALAKLKTADGAKQAEVDGYTKRIQAILDKASKENRALELSEQQEINSIQEKMRTNAVQALSEQEVESKVILERLKSYGGRITAEQASEVIKNANKQRDDSVAAANTQYEDTLRNIIRMRDESKVITADQAEKMIADAEKQKTESINKAEGLRSGVVEKITSMNSETSKSVNLNTGNILTKWDKLKNWWDSWWPKPKNVTVNTGSPYIGSNASGTDSWQGGLTSIHERGYELYDLPQGTRIFNHDASQDLVIKTAEAVARGIMGNVQNGLAGAAGGPSEIAITIPITLDGRILTAATSRVQLQNNKNRSRALGVVRA